MSWAVSNLIYNVDQTPEVSFQKGALTEGDPVYINSSYLTTEHQALSAGCQFLFHTLCHLLCKRKKYKLKGKLIRKLSFDVVR